MIYCDCQSGHGLSVDELKRCLLSGLEKLGNRKRILIIPPDATRFHSRSGELTEAAWEFFGDNVTGIIPALGTHVPLESDEIERMFGRIPKSLFRVHNWRKNVSELGTIPRDLIREASEGKLDFSWTVEVNSLLVSGGHDLILSIGQVVPHEVTGMANYNKNIFVGLGGKESIDNSHFLGAVYGMERIMGRADTPVRKILNFADENFISRFPVVYVLTVLGSDKNGKMVPVGFFMGDDVECFHRASRLSQKVNITFVTKPLKKIIVYLDRDEYKSSWLGNKSIYRTRMAIEDGGELVVLAPGVQQFGEDGEIDKLIRKYGYSGAAAILNQVSENDDLRNSLSAAAHLIHGSSEGRFTITYCPGYLRKMDVEGVGYRFGVLHEMLQKYNPDKLKEGYNITDTGEEIYYISNPATGLWTTSERFEE